MSSQKESRKPSWLVSLIPFLILAALLFFVVSYFGADALAGGSQVALIFSGGIAAAIALIFYNADWKHIESCIADNIKSVVAALVILLLIGAISGSWMISGIVPTLIYYGLKVITPGIFLFATCIICALVSMMTGSSWTTIATIGVALLGIGSAEGFSTGWTAGAIISGAYFGDKISPLSDTTVLASSSAGTPLFEHIKYMMITTVPSFTIASVIFLLASIFHNSDAANQSVEISEALKSSFHLSGWLMLVPVATGVMIAKKLPAIITLFASAVLAGIFAIIFQPDIVSMIANGTDTASALNFKDAFKGIFITYYDSTAVQTGSEMLDNLVATRGMNGMLSTIFLILCATTFGGILTGCGFIQSLTEMLTRKIRSRFSLVASTVATGITSNMITGDQYLSIILTSSLCKKLYDKLGYEGRLLSRATEDSATVTSVLIPWNSCGMTQATVLRVPTLEYLPYCFFNLISPLMSMFIAAIGYKIYKKASE